MDMIKAFGHVFGGALLVAGTSIGVGMLALPVATASGGFIPSLLIYTLCWLFMLCTGLLILETCIWMPKDANFITLSSRLLGNWGRSVCWMLYLFLFSLLMIAHIAGGGSIITLLFDNSLPIWLSTMIYVIAFAPVVYLGTLWVDRVNTVLMLGIAISYVVFVGSSVRYIDLSLLARMEWKKSWIALPIIFTAFGYQSLIPTLFNYMNRHIRKMRLAIIIGTSIPLLIYIVWEMLILGIVPLEGTGGLTDAATKGENAVNPLGIYLHNPTLLRIGQSFACFAMTTSFLGISIAFIDFLADGLKMEKQGRKRIGLCALIFLVPLLVTLINPNLFLVALGYAGGFGVALLLGAMPIMMVWAGRYYQGHSLLHQQLPGGKITLSILMAFVALEIAITLTL